VNDWMDSCMKGRTRLKNLARTACLLAYLLTNHTQLSGCLVVWLFGCLAVVCTANNNSSSHHCISHARMNIQVSAALRCSARSRHPFLHLLLLLLLLLPSSYLT
jgi:hypothetical protein